MVDGMVEAWAWSPADRTVLVLPLNHVHGLVNVTLTSLAVGATLRGAGRRSTPPHVWERLASRRGDGVHGRADHLRPAGRGVARPPTTTTQQRWSAGAAGLRLMVSGSAALPVSTLDRVARADRPHAARALRDDRARHGAVEHARSRGCRATSASRCPASRCASSTTPATPSPMARPASCWCAGRRCSPGTGSGPTRPPTAFVDGWFRTGDVAVHEPGRLPPARPVVGRHHQDRRREGVGAGDRGGLPHPSRHRRLRRRRPRPTTSGASACAAAVVAPDATLDADELRAWGKQQLAAAKVPSRFTFVDDLPRNTLGKVIKPEVSKLFD